MHEVTAKQLEPSANFSIPFILALAEVQLWVYINVHMTRSTFRKQNSKVNEMNIRVVYCTECYTSDYCDGLLFVYINL